MNSFNTEATTAVESIVALENNTKQAISQKRANTRINGSFPTTVQPANVSDRNDSPGHAVCKDVSRTGCRLVANKPLHVGNVYLISVEGGAVKLPSLFCRCVRCSLLGENAFECGMAFFSEIQLPGTQADSPSDLI